LGYVLSGGGARGFAQIGMLKVLEEEGIYPDYIVGASIGSIVGGLYAMGYSPAEMESLLLRVYESDIIDEGYHRKDIFTKQKRWPSYGNMTLFLDDAWKLQIPSGVINGRKLDLATAELFMSASSIRDFRDMPVDFASLTIDLLTGELLVLRDGSPVQAVRAAAAIPNLISPFTVDGRSYIDGGLLQNMPVPQVMDMGADKVLTLKVNSSLRDLKQAPVSILDILNHTINIAMHQSIDRNVELCDLMLEPNLTGISNIAYGKSAKIVAVGEAYARDNIGRIRAFRDSLLAEGYTFKKPIRTPDLDHVQVTSIECRGNVNISAETIIMYSGLKTGRSYTPAQLIDACLRVWNSQAFRTVYPILEPETGGYRVVLYVTELKRRGLVVNLSYTNEEKLNLGLALRLDDILLRNSRLLAGLTLGGRTEFAVDYVKDFGEFWGAYFRLFPYINENRLYLYDDDHHRTGSVKTLEYGVTPGVGFFADRILTAEAYGFAYRPRLYRDVSETAPVDSLNRVSGFGLKAYHESLDDDLFPMSGLRAFAKADFSRWDGPDTDMYGRVSVNADVYAHILKPLSLRGGFDLGTYLGSQGGNPADPFYFSGPHGYKGYERYAVSAPHYNYYTLSVILSPLKNLFLEAGAQGLNFNGARVWDFDQQLQWSYFADLGYKTPVGPLNFGYALREGGDQHLSLSIGYDTDLFWFSRR
jgi:NTE family protein